MQPCLAFGQASSSVAAWLLDRLQARSLPGFWTGFIKKGDTPNDAWEKAKGQYGRVEDAAKIIDPRKE